jgi:hypothetical protein
MRRDLQGKSYFNTTTTIEIKRTCRADSTEYIAAMTRATTLIVAALAFVCNAAAAKSQSPVTFESPCECRDNHGEHRWAVKNDPSTPPTDASAIQAVTPSDVFGWPGPAEHLTQSSERTGIENNWFALTGRVVDMKVEMDGDLHLALQDATGGKPGIVVVEVPAEPQLCSIRQTVFSWTTTRFPFHTSSDRKLKLIETPIITVTGKAYWDVGHAPKDQSNRRSTPKGFNE